MSYSQILSPGVSESSIVATCTNQMFKLAAESIVFANENTVTYAITYQKKDSITACTILDNADTSTIGNQCSIAACQAASNALIQGKGSLEAYLKSSALLRTFIRRVPRDSVPMSMAIIDIEQDRIEIAWSGDLFVLRFRDHAHSIIARPSRIGRLDFAHDPLGNSPALIRQKTQDNDLFLTLTADIAPNMINDKDLMAELGSSCSAPEAARALNHASKKHAINSGAASIILNSQRLLSQQGALPDPLSSTGI